MCYLKLAEFEDNENMDGLLVLMQTCGGDVESGLAIAEMIASLSKHCTIGYNGGTSCSYEWFIYWSTTNL